VFRHSLRRVHENVRATIARLDETEERTGKKGLGNGVSRRPQSELDFYAGIDRALELHKLSTEVVRAGIFRLARLARFGLRRRATFSRKDGGRMAPLLLDHCFDPKSLVR
jgi:hypothetical protein